MNPQAQRKLERRIIAMCLILIGVGVGLILRMPGHVTAMEEKRQYDAEFYEFAEVFSEIYAAIRSRYVEDVPSTQLFEGAINGMFMTLDPHSAYLPPQQQKDLAKDTEGQYSGVGLHITLRDRILTVISVMGGGPAARAGVAAWDRIVEIDGETTENITLPQAVEKLTGPIGTRVKIKVWREGEPEPLEFELVRDKIKVNSVFHRILDDQIGYLRIARFQDDTARAVEEALNAFNDANVRGVMVDVRNDSGGLLDRAVEVCDLFLPQGQLIVSIQGRIKANDRKFFALDPALCEQPLVVLVNQSSASASEIFAGAMKDTGRGIIVGPAGKTTFGKGSVQTISTLRHSLERDDNGDPRPSGIRLTTARYYTPSGTSIHEKGIEPDIGVEVPRENEIELLRHGMIGDPSLIEPGEAQPADEDAATTGSENLTRQLDQQRNGETDDEKPEFRDILLEEALKYMKAVLLFAERRAA